jgi:shikimate kinase
MTPDEGAQAKITPIGAPLTAQEARRVAAALEANIGRALKGKRDIVELSLAALAAGGHLLLEDVPGVGKTTLAQALARRLGWLSDDVDALIEARERRTVAEIFAREGEPYFRAVERQVILALIPIRHSVIATGGGTFVDADNRAAINADGVSVWIDVPFEVLLTRIPADGRRPLANDRLQMAMLFEARRLAYQQARIRLDAARARPEELVDQLLEILD